MSTVHFSAEPRRYLYQDPNTGETFEIGQDLAYLLSETPAVGETLRVVAVDEEAGTITLSSGEK